MLAPELFLVLSTPATLLSGSLVTTAHLQVADGGKAFQIGRVAENILNKYRGCPPTWLLGMGLTTPHHLKKNQRNSLLLG
jgi:hypothetical protein